MPTATEAEDCIALDVALLPPLDWMKDLHSQELNDLVISHEGRERAHSARFLCKRMFGSLGMFQVGEVNFTM